ncbi:MAG: hypothetical protein RBS57_15855 [Desulforhabdus sp.]|nr:hypothetical protein [Desulforhabdus sp.]
MPQGKWRVYSYLFELHFRPSAARQQQLRPELVELLHETFIDHPDYDSEHLPEFLAADIYMRVLVGGKLIGIFTADLLRTDGEPFVHLSAGLVKHHSRSGGALMQLSMGLTLDLACQAFGTAAFFVALRTANPRAIARLWANRWVRFYPRRNWHENDPRLTTLRRHFCAQAFGAERCDLEGIVFYDIYPTPPWGGNPPWHHDETVNELCRRHLRPHGLDAFLFIGPTLPPFEDIPQSGTLWPLGPR